MWPWANHISSVNSISASVTWMSQNKPSRAPFCFSGAVSSSSSEISYQQASNFSSLFSLPNLRAFPVASGRFSSGQLLSHVLLFATPWTTARQASLSITSSQSPPKPMSIESVIQPSHPLSSYSPPALNLSQHQGLFQWVGSCCGYLFPITKWQDDFQGVGEVEDIS